MPLEDLPKGFTVATRDEVREQFQNDVQLRFPGAPRGVGSQAFNDGAVIADTLMPIYADAQSIGSDANLDDKTLEGLKAEARGMGIPELLPASGGSGFVKITASAGGVTIEAGRELFDEKTSLRYQCAVTDTYFDAQPVPIVGFDTGPTTNLPAGRVLTWRSPPPGLGERATILADSNGDGLTGGRNEETADELRARIRSEHSQPAAAGNVAHIRRLVREAGKFLGIAVQECFVYPAIFGAGTYAFAFTLRPAKPGGSRAPNSTEIAKVLAYIQGQLPEDDGIFPCVLVENGVTILLQIDWSPGVGGWTDLNRFPATEAEGWYVSAVTSATQFEIQRLSGTAVPQVGQTIAFYNPSTGKFARKRIGSVTGAGPYAIVCDTANNASDTLHTPSVNERFCPWSDSLDLLVEPLALEFDKLGPGEQVEGELDAGYRQRRVPLTQLEWHSTLRHKMLDGIDDLPQIGDVQWLSPDLPYTTPIGSAGIFSNLLTFSRLLVFPQ